MKKNYIKKIVSIVLVFIMCITFCSCKSSDYNYAEQLFEEGRYDEAHIAFKKLANYKDSQDRAEECLNKKLYISALCHYNNENYIEARDIFESLGDYKDSKYYADDIRSNAKPLFKLLNGNYRGFGGFSRWNTYYFFDAEEKTFNLVISDDEIWTCRVVPTGDDTFCLTELDEFDYDFDYLASYPPDHINRINCQVSDTGDYITITEYYDRYVHGNPYFKRIEE